MYMTNTVDAGQVQKSVLNDFFPARVIEIREILGDYYFITGGRDNDTILWNSSNARRHWYMRSYLILALAYALIDKLIKFEIFNWFNYL